MIVDRVPTRLMVWGGFACRFLLGTVLAFSALSHLLEPVAFLDAVYSYRLLGKLSGWLCGVLLPPMELALAICFLTGRFLKPALATACGLFVVFVLAQATVVVRGLTIDCGCFGRFSHTVGWASLAMTTGLLGMSAAGLWLSVPSQAPQ